MSDLTPIKLPTRLLLTQAAENEFTQILTEYYKVNAGILKVHDLLKDFEESANELDLGELYTAVNKARVHFGLAINHSFQDIQSAITRMKP